MTSAAHQFSCHFPGLTSHAPHPFWAWRSVRRPFKVIRNFQQVIRDSDIGCRGEAPVTADASLWKLNNVAHVVFHPFCISTMQKRGWKCLTQKGTENFSLGGAA